MIVEIRISTSQKIKRRKVEKCNFYLTKVTLNGILLMNNDINPLHIKSPTTLLNYIFYNTKIKTYANGSKKITYHSYDTCIGAPGLNRVGSCKSSAESQEHSKFISLLRSKQNIIDLAYHNGLVKPWEYFLTLTFDPSIIDSTDYAKVGEVLTRWINNMKHQNKQMEYIIVPEPHKSGRIHFHGIFRNVPNWKLTPARSPKSNRLIKKNGIQIYNLNNYKFGYSTVSKVSNLEAVSVYISKYMTKELLDLSYKKRYWSSKSLLRPDVEYARFNEKTLEYYISNLDNITSYVVKDDGAKKSIYVTSNNICYVNLYKYQYFSLL
jgi:hypothetical protein